MFRISPRAIPRILAWIMLVSIFTILISSCFKTEEEVVEAPRNYDSQISNVAVSFVKEWLKFDKGETANQYQLRIAPFVSSKILNTNAGISFSEKNPPQAVANAWFISYTKPDATHYTVNVGAQLRTNGVVRNVVVNVPLAYVETLNQFYVYENPSFSPVIVAGEVSSVNFGDTIQVNDSNQLKVTMTNFFTKYIESSDPAELSNFLTETAKTSNSILPKGGIVEFKSIGNIQVFDVGATVQGNMHIYTAKVPITTYEPESKVTITSDYILMVFEEGSKYLIERIAP